jgi:RimJ/RimL family protein N-acetyltransferase
MAFRRGGISPFWHDLALCPDELYSFHASRLADLGVIVSAAHRGKGIATKVIKQLIAYARAKELRSQGAKTNMLNRERQRGRTESY